MPFITLITAAVNAQHLPPELTYPPVARERLGDDDARGNDGGDNANNDGDGGKLLPFSDDDSELMDAGEPGFYFSTDMTLFDGAFTGINAFVYRSDTGAVSFEQDLRYDLRRDKLRNTRHYFNAAGSLKRTPFAPLPWLSPGLDWTPVAQYSSDRGGHNALSTIDIGPTADIDAFGVPVYLRAGVSGRRVDSLAGVLKPGEARSSVGVYGAFGVGSWEEPLPFAPIYFFADGIGRQIERSSMASLTSSLLGATRIGENDSLFVYGYASLFNGREGYLESSADSRIAHFVETPWRVERNVNATIGYRGDQKFIVFPSAYYSVGENTLEFLNDTRKRDEKTTRQILSGAIATDSAAGMYYSGALSFEWRDHDKLFGRKMAATSTPDNLDSLEVNLWDYSAFDPRTAHRLEFRLPWSLRAKYDFSLSRIFTEYPNSYVSGRDTITNKDDSDRRTRQHRVALEYKNDSTFRTEIFGEDIQYELVFLKQAKSSSNRTDRTQRAGFVVEWSPLNELLLTEAVSAEAKRGEFHFPEFHQRALQRPRYSRALNSSLSAVWQATPLVGFNGSWDIKFSDYGFWYGREYMEEILAVDPGARVNYYAISSKSVYYTIDAAVRLNPGDGMFQAGGSITVARDRNYEDGNYILTNENGLSVKPYLNARWRFGDRVEAAAHLSRTFVSGSREMGFWDFRLLAEGAF